MTNFAPGQRFEVLDGMRGIGALIVLTAHGSRSVFLGASPAIDMFFLHSGFILAYVTATRINDRSFAGSFIISRLIRLLPLYWAGMLLGALVTGYLIMFGGWGWSNLAFAKSVVLSIFILPNFGSPDEFVFPTNIVAWSLFFEFFINILIAFTRFRLNVVFILWLISIPALLLSFWIWKDAGGGGTEDFAGGFARVSYSFFVGVIIFHIVQSDRLNVIRLPWWVCLTVILLMYLPTFENNYYGIFLTFIAQPLLFILFANARIEGLPARIALTLGLMSYAVYIFHIPIQYLAEHFARQWLDVPLAEPAPWFGWVIAAPITLVFSYFMTFTYDVKVRKAMRDFVKRRRWFSSQRAAGA